MYLNVASLLPHTVTMAPRVKFGLLRTLGLAVLVVLAVVLLSRPNAAPAASQLQTSAGIDTPNAKAGKSLSDQQDQLSEFVKEELQSQEKLKELAEPHDTKTAASAAAGAAAVAAVAHHFDGYKESVKLAQSYPRQNATMLTLCRNEDLEDTLKAVRNLEDRFNRYFHYDWVFLNNEPFAQEFKDRVSRAVSGQAKFGLIPKEHWSYPDFIDQDFAKKERDRMAADGVIYADSESYRHMCRFNSGFFFKHPLMLDYKYYWRVEPHVDFWCDVKNDPFKTLSTENQLYGFTISIHEFHRTIETLWESTKEFIKLNPQFLHKNNFMDFVSDDDGDSYNLCHFWSNFEIADMDFWRGEAYQAYFDFLDKKGGFFYERWGDAPVHSIAIALFEDKNKIHYFKEIGYTHGVYSMCPIEDSIYDEYNCFCDKHRDFTFEGYSCGNKYYEAMKLTKPANWEMYA